MVFIPPQLIIAGAQLAFGAATQFIGDKKKDDRARKQTQQNNRIRLRDFAERERRFKEREAALKEENRLDIEKLKDDYQAAQVEVQRGTESGLTRLADLSDDMILRAETRQRSLARVAGRYKASGQTGNSRDRLENLPRGEVGRAASVDAGTETRAKGAFLFNQKRLRYEAQRYMESRYNQQKRRNYDPGPRPFFEGLEEAPARTANRNLLGNALGLAGKIGSGLIEANSNDPFNGNRDPLNPRGQSFSGIGWGGLAGSGSSSAALPVSQQVTGAGGLGFSPININNPFTQNVFPLGYEGMAPILFGGGSI